jgi:class 3 adenylate cyclase
MSVANGDRPPRSATPGPSPPRWPLFWKYFIVLFGAVVVTLLASGLSEALFGYRDLTASLSRRLGAQAQSAAGRIDNFLDSIVGQLGWAVQLPWTPGSEQRHRVDVLRLMQLAPAIVDVTLVDGTGIERLHVSRVEPDVIGSGVDRSNDEAVLGAFSQRVWYGPVTLHEGSEPHMTIAVAGPRASAGAAIAEINLKLIWDVISTIHIGETGNAFVLDRPGHLVAHPDISLVLRGADPGETAILKTMQNAAATAAGEAASVTDLQNRPVMVAAAAIAGPAWTVFAEQPLAEALAPIRASLWRATALLLSGAAFAALLAYLLARRMVGPIRRLEEGAERIGAGQFDHKIEIKTDDELEQLADRFNSMADELALSQERSERIARLKRFLAPQVAELVDRTGEDAMLDGHRAEIVVVFCDLRGFTAFASEVEADETMGVLGEYYEALGRLISTYEATLTNMSGDGLMILLNAPLPRSDPLSLGFRMTVEMQKAVQSLIARWRERGHSIGFGVGLAKGVATVGRIGYEGRVDYTAIGSVVNLASRLCSAAADGQILICPTSAREADGAAQLRALGRQQFKGFPEGIEVYEVCWRPAESQPSDGTAAAATG